MNRTYAQTAVVHPVRGGTPLAARFILTAGVILAVTGAAKLWSALGTSKFLAAVDPIIGIKFGPLMLTVGIAEIAVALVCCLSKRQTLALGLVAWLATNFLVYRVGLGWMDWKRPCGCLGNLTDALHLAPQMVDNIMKVLLADLLMASYALLISHWRQKRKWRAERIPVVCTTLLLLGFLSHSFASEDSFSASGIVTYQNLSFDRVIVEQEDCFQVCVSDCNWHIKKIPLRFIKRGETQPLADYGLASSDCTNFYQVSSFGGIVQSSAKSGNSTAARIGPGTVPFGLSDPKYIVLWYAFASSDYFRKLPDNYLNPPTVLRKESLYAADFRVSGLWRLQSVSPFLPTEIVFDGEPQSNAKSKRIEARAWHFTNCVFKVQEVMNVGPFVLPKTISVEYYRPNYTNKTVLLPSARMMIRVTNALQGVLIDRFRPDIPAAALISDLRTISSNSPFGVAYDRATDWPKLQDSRTAALLASQKARFQHQMHTRTISTRAILAILILLPLALFLLKRNLRTKI